MDNYLINEIIMAKLNFFAIFNYSIMPVISYCYLQNLTHSTKQNRDSDKWKETQ